MGILDGSFDPQTQGLLAAAFQGLQSSGPSRMPMSLGQIIGQGGSAGMSTYAQAIKEARAQAQAQQLIELEKQKAELTKAQIEKMKREAVMNDKLMGLFGDAGSQGLNSDKLDQLGTMLSLQLHPGGGVLTNLAERQRKAEDSKATMGLLQSRPAPITETPTFGMNQGGAGMRSIIPPSGGMVQPPGFTEPVPQEVANAAQQGGKFAVGVGPSQNPAENQQRVGGLFSNDMQSQDPAQASQGLMGQTLVDQASGRSANPQHFIDMQARLAAAAAARQQQMAMANMAAANRSPQIVQTDTGPGAVGKDLTVTPLRDESGNAIKPVPKTSNAGSGEFTPETLSFTAQQYLAGDRQAAQGFARNATARIALQNAIVDEAQKQGLNPKQTAAKMAEFAGVVSGSRTVGQRAANISLAATEADEMIDIVKDSSEKFGRTNFVPWNMALKAFESGTGSPEIAAFGASVNALVNVYARAINPTGVPTIADKEHAREVLNTVQSPQQVDAVLGIIRKELDIAKRAPEIVRATTRAGITGDKVAPKVSNYTDADIKATALKYKISVDEVKQRLGIQ